MRRQRENYKDKQIISISAREHFQGATKCCRYTATKRCRKENKKDHKLNQKKGREKKEEQRKKGREKLKEGEFLQAMDVYTKALSGWHKTLSLH